MSFLHSTLSQLADKAQDAINKTPLAQHIPSSVGGRQGSSSSSHDGSKNSNSTLNQLSHQFRSLQIQYGYSSATPVQRIITTQKGVALDLESLKRDVQAQSKELYMWGKGEAADLQDVTDRLAWLNYISGALASSTADKLNSARTPLKTFRDHDAALAPRRNARAGLQTQIDRLEQGKERGYEKRIVDLRAQLRRAEEEDAAAERESEIAKRKAIRESEQLKFEALREFGEKLSLIAQASVPILDVLPPIPPSDAQPYHGADMSGSVRALLQHSLDSWKPGDVTLRAPAGAMLDRANTRAFGETHAMELSKIDTDHPHADAAPMGSPGVVPGGAAPPPMPVPVHHPSASVSSHPSMSASTLPTVQEKETAPAAVPVPAPAPIPAAAAASGAAAAATSPVPRASPVSRASMPSSSSSPAIDPNMLNNSPAPIPFSSPLPASVASVASNTSVELEAKLPAVTPTVAETGVPITAKAQDPGPASGSLKNLHSPTSSPTALHGATSYGAAPKLETAGEEKKRLEREERERMLHASGSTASSSAAHTMPKYESAQEEKQRLEREERERLLRGDAAPPSDRRQDEEGDETGGLPPPPYQDF